MEFVRRPSYMICVGRGDLGDNCGERIDGERE